MEQVYTREFYRWNRRLSDDSARLIATTLINMFEPRSIADVGCATGRWLRAFSDAGVARCQGFDGKWVPLDDLLIPKAWFATVDLSTEMPDATGFDLAVCLEVAEHLPCDRSQWRRSAASRKTGCRSMPRAFR